LKLLTFHGPAHHTFVVPGHFTLAGGESVLVEDHVADWLTTANPNSHLTAAPAPSKRGKRQESQPEAHKGEGQPTATDPQEE